MKIELLYPMQMDIIKGKGEILEPELYNYVAIEGKQVIFKKSRLDYIVQTYRIEYKDIPHGTRIKSDGSKEFNYYNGKDFFKAKKIYLEIARRLANEMYTAYNDKEQKDKRRYTGSLWELH